VGLAIIAITPERGIGIVGTTQLARNKAQVTGMQNKAASNFFHDQVSISFDRGRFVSE
jgi:hypothetical protein